MILQFILIFLISLRGVLGIRVRDFFPHTLVMVISPRILVKVTFIQTIQITILILIHSQRMVIFLHIRIKAILIFLIFLHNLAIFIHFLVEHLLLLPQILGMVIFLLLRILIFKQI